MSARPTICCVPNVEPDGWLTVILTATNKKISLPQQLKCQLSSSTPIRDSFQILEGAYKGQMASVARKSPSASYLVPYHRHLGPATVRFDRAKQALWYGKHGPFSAFSGGGGGFSQIAPGSYSLQIPDSPHDKTRSAYGTYHARHHKTWFRIGASPSGSRYLHVGEISEGCVTFRPFTFSPTAPPPQGFEDLPAMSKDNPGWLGLPSPSAPAPVGSWDSLYDYLIGRRAGDQSVGTLTVV